MSEEGEAATIDPPAEDGGGAPNPEEPVLDASTSSVIPGEGVLEEGVAPTEDQQAAVVKDEDARAATPPPDQAALAANEDAEADAVGGNAAAADEVSLAAADEVSLAAADEVSLAAADEVSLAAATDVEGVAAENALPAASNGDASAEEAANVEGSAADAGADESSDAAELPAHSSPEISPPAVHANTVTAPVKTKGSPQFPLAELTRSGDLPYYTPAQVAAHAVAADCWLSLLGKVIDMTHVVRSEAPELVQSIIAAAGSDVSHWFTKDGELKTVHDLKSGLRRYQTPGDLPLLHAPPPHPDASFDMSFAQPWWRQEQLIVGVLTQKTRKLRVVNMLLSSSHVIDVCAEQKICDINDLYRSYNAHAGSYTWKKLNEQGKMEVLDDGKTLQDNGLPDMSKELAELLIDEAEFLPAVYLYFDDDLTKA